MRHVQLEDDSSGGLICRQNMENQNHGDLIEFMFPDNSTVLVRVLDCNVTDSFMSCNNCPFVKAECPVFELPDKTRVSICRLSQVYEKVGSSMEEL